MRINLNSYYVYFHLLNDTDNINDIFYVGKGVGDRSLSTRSRNAYWHNKVNKNKGYFVKHVFENLTEKEALDLEIFYISIFGQWHDGGLLVNMTEGGDGAKGNKLTIEQRNKISVALKGRVGKPLTEEAKLKISIAKSGVKQSYEVIRKRADKLIGVYKETGYTVDMYDKNLNLIGNYKCVTEICKKYNLQNVRGNIFGCLNKTRRTAGGFIFNKKYEANVKNDGK